MSVSSNLKKQGVNLKRPKSRAEPLWAGPERDGVTFSLLSRFLVCRERFRLLVVHGLKPVERFESTTGFGSMWHVCEERHAAQQVWVDGKNVKVKPWSEALEEYFKMLCRQFSMQRQEIEHWYNVTRCLFPLYVDHWAKHPDVVARTPLLQEKTFDVPYHLPSGRVVRLRGKWDSVDVIGKGKEAGVYLQENKTKSSIDQGKLSRQLRFDLQTMMYLIALEREKSRCKSVQAAGTGQWEQSLAVKPVFGVRYNVVRRSAHKSTGSMLQKISDDRDAARMEEWFCRWRVEVTPGDVAKFRQMSFDPILEQLCDWWEWIKAALLDPWACGKKGLDRVGTHWLHPFGVWNVLNEGGSSDLDECILTGSEAGLRAVETLYPELV